MSNTPEKVDFIITWVDGNDPVWQAEKAKYQAPTAGDTRNVRYREWDILRYWFRSIETFAPWVNKIYFVTCGHLPAWLNTEHPKLVIVNHKDYIPEKWLPTFSSRPIDMNFHRIESLSEHFVYFNDDMYLLQPTTVEDFFHDGLPMDAAMEEPVYSSGRDHNGNNLSNKSMYTASFYNTAVINRHFKKRDCIRQNRGKWYTTKYGKWLFNNLLLSRWPYFIGLRNAHLPYSYLKSTYSKVWELEGEILSSACEHKFRAPNDVNHVVFSFWQIAEGNFYPRRDSVGKLLSIRNSEERNQEIYDAITHQSSKFFCINDQYSGDDFEGVKEKLKAAFESVFPEKSSFETA